MTFLFMLPVILLIAFMILLPIIIFIHDIKTGEYFVKSCDLKHAKSCGWYISNEEGMHVTNKYVCYYLPSQQQCYYIEFNAYIFSNLYLINKLNVYIQNITKNKDEIDEAIKEINLRAKVREEVRKSME